MQTSGEGANNLTPQEARVMAFVAVGWSNKEIAKELRIFEGTVKVHLKAIMRKLKLKNRTLVALFAHGIEVARAAPLATVPPDLQPSQDLTAG